MLYHITLPVIVMTFASLGGMTRYVRSAMIDALSMDYIRTARAKGLKEKVVIYSHAWRNALLPVITSIIGWFLGIFSGSVIIENTFSLNGMGKLYWQGLNNLDFELVLAIQMFYTVVSLLGSLLIDISCGLVAALQRLRRLTEPRPAVPVQQAQKLRPLRRGQHPFDVRFGKGIVRKMKFRHVCHCLPSGSLL